MKYELRSPVSGYCEKRYLIPIQIKENLIRNRSFTHINSSSSVLGKASVSFDVWILSNNVGLEI